MFDLTIERECAGYHVESIDFAADVTLVGDDFHLNRIYLWLGIEYKLGSNSQRFKKTDLRIPRPVGDLYHVYREVPETDPYYQIVVDELNRNRGEVIAHLIREQEAA